MKGNKIDTATADGLIQIIGEENVEKAYNFLNGNARSRISFASLYHTVKTRRITKDLKDSKLTLEQISRKHNVASSTVYRLFGKSINLSKSIPRK